MPIKILKMLVLIILFISSCSRNLKTSNGHGYVSTAALRWADKSIFVCFEDDGFDIERQNVEKAVKNAFLDAGFRFIGWSPCESNTPDKIRIHFNSGSPISVAKVFGAGLAGEKSGVVLGLADTSCRGDFAESVCLKNNAIHEFGHALGLHHEMNRFDTTNCENSQNDERLFLATQIGDYDEHSIMNYCELNKSNSNGELLTPSNGDIQAIWALYNSPIARVDSKLPLKIKKEEFSIKIFGDGVKEYRFFAAKSLNDDCNSLTLYSKVFSISQIIGPEILKDAIPGQGFKICILGGNGQSGWQPTSAYTSVYYEIINPDDLRAPELTALEFFEDPLDNSRFIVTAKFNDDSDVFDFSIGINYVDIPLKTVFTAKNSKNSDIEDSIKLYVPKNLFQANGKIFISELKLIDINGNAKVYLADTKSFKLSQEIEPIFLKIVDKIDFKVRNSEIFSLNFDILSIKNDKKIPLIFNVSDGFDLQRIRIKLINRTTNKTKLFYGDVSNIIKISDNNYTFVLDLSNWSITENGLWKVQAVEIFDFFGLNAKIFLAHTDDEIFDQSIIVSPSFFVRSALKFFECGSA